MTDHPDLGHVQWENYTHQSMWDMLVPANPNVVMQRATDLDRLAKDMGDDIEAVRSLLQKLLSSWTGPAADRTASALHPVLDWAAGAATTGTEIAARLGRYADAINKARAHMPAPVDATQLNAVADGKTVTVGPLSTNAHEVAEMAQGHTATAHAARTAKNNAVQVMRTYEHESAATYHGLPTFHRPPRTPRVVSKPPTEGPPIKGQPVMPPPRTVPPPVKKEPQPVKPEPTPPGTVAASGPPASTSLSSFVGPPDGSGMGGGLGGMLGGGGVLGGAGAGAGAGALPGPAAVTGAGPMSGVDTMAAEAAMSRTAAAEAAEQGGWTGFGPMGQGGARSQQDGTHRDKYAGRPDIFGELPAAFPPVLGL